MHGPASYANIVVRKERRSRQGLIGVGTSRDCPKIGWCAPRNAIRGAESVPRRVRDRFTASGDNAMSLTCAWSRSASSRDAVVMLQETTESLAALHFTRWESQHAWRVFLSVG
jgi:hypothetical protein